MIRGIHTMFYTSEPEALRAFIRDKLGFTRYTDVGEGWLIFECPEADMGCHPAGSDPESRSGTQNISFYCDDIHKTKAELESRGVKFTQDVVDEGYGLVTHFAMPGGFTAQLYQPLYTKRPGA